MIKYIAFLLFFALQITSVSAETCKDGRKFIFIVHGIAGKESDFGSLKDILNKNSCYKAQHFNYDTANSTLSTYDFARSLDGFVRKTLANNKVTLQDKISLVVHSQGGLVSSLWLKMIKEGNPELFKKVDAFITLSTPYWGAAIAEIGQTFFFAFGCRNNVISPFGCIQLQEMNFGSATIHNLLENYHNLFKSSSIRPLAIGGLKKSYHLFGEDDTTVPIYSSRPDHYYHKGFISLGDSESTISESDFVKSNNIPFIPVFGAHIKMHIPGVADIPETCVQMKDCEHPTLSYILKHLAKQPLDIGNSAFQFKEYRVNVYLEGLDKIGLSERDVWLTYDNGFKSVGFEKKKNSHPFATITGKTIGFEKEMLELTLEIDGHTRTIKTPVEGGHSSFINLKID